MHLIRRFRIPALFCALAVLVCELVSRPYANMGICDDWPYILMAQKLAVTGHVTYNGWTSAMLGSQLYLGAGFIKLFGFSLTTVRMSTLLVAMALAFVLQRTLVRANISERNATIGTLALVLSPLYLMLSVTFMSDIYGLFAIVICLYGCLRALQASTSRATIAWLCFAVATNAICGTSRQIAWLGVLVMVPSTLWLLRARRRVLFAGAAATIVGFLFVFGCMHWLQQQPYVIPAPALGGRFPLYHALWRFLLAFLDVPFLLLPVAALFLPEIRKSRPRVIAALFLLFLLIDVHPKHPNQIFLLEPTMGDWIGRGGIFGGFGLNGGPHHFLRMGELALLTILSFGGLIGLFASLLRSRKTRPAARVSTSISWNQLGVVLVPFTLAYIFFLIPSAATFYFFDRYLLALLIVALVFLVRYYQEEIRLRLPPAAVLLVAIMAICGIAVTHNMFSVYRARVNMATELHAAGVPDTSIDNGWEYNFGVELQHADYINDPRIVIPAHAYTPVSPPSADTCSMYWYYNTPHIHPLYGIRFTPNACYGPAPFAPVRYSRWLASSPGTLYVVKYIPPSKHP